MPDPQFDPSQPFTVQSSGGFDPSKPFTVEAPQPSYAATVEDRLVGLGKRVMRAGQQIGNIPKVFGAPGLSEFTDAAFQFPKGTSWNASEPSNQAQSEGGQYTAALASLAATGGAADVPIAPPNLAPGVRVIGTKTMGDVAIKSGSAISDALTSMGEGFVKAARKDLVGGGPITAAKIGRAVEKFGVKAVKAAAYGAGAGLIWEAWRSK